ncbi:glucosylglycerol 3-phosphatase [Cyanobium sp. CH-040]|uniref:glucosylglycerol 3-phosphatase n=1 Tax=Cyanobium sp. CH-040 TaxID=2823708 RepID=UPI0020CDC3A6|nr:glucosylglycerol 3-phosphatase [Cyanobium sp. CH-040]MCP9928706.1 glucosylglycerol 3-phosphatase [Cyanobium sp. CH-040]
MDALTPAELLSELRPRLGDPAGLLLVQDLDGVCMDLVRDPLCRRLEGSYVRDARRLDGSFSVLTNGEHEGRRGVNRLVERALGCDREPGREGLYLPGLAAGGVQLQNRHGEVATPGVSAAELAFLTTLPARMAEELRAWLPQLLPQLKAEALEHQIALAVLDNPLSPTVNLNGLFRLSAASARPLALARELQQGLLELMQRLLDEAGRSGLADRFFLHIAPNVLDDEGGEQPVWASAAGIGTTDVQFMLRGAIKEAGLLVLLNRHIARHHGVHPLGEAFNVRTAPRSHQELLALAEARIPPELMPQLVGIGDTITSTPGPTPGSWRRGGSDRGFLTLLQDLGRRFDRPNRVVLVDSSGGEVCRPSMADGSLRGLTDPGDPLRLDALFPGGPAQYRAFFAELAAAASPRALQP